MTPCPKCNSVDLCLLGSRLSPTLGYRRRRYECRKCGHRYTTYDGKLASEIEHPQPRRMNTGKRRFTDEQVTEIITSDASSRELSRQFQVSHQTIAAIRSGKCYWDVWLRLYPGVQPEAYSRSCCTCLHWVKGACGFGFPESAKSLQFARECNTFVENKHEIAH